MKMSNRKCDLTTEFLVAHFSDPPLKENGVAHVISANKQLMELADVKAHLYAHHSDPPEITNDAKIATDKATMDGNLKKHPYAHHSDPPMIDAKIVAKDATPFRSNRHDRALKHEVKQVSNLINPCCALVMDHRCLPYLVPWTEMEGVFKLWISVNCYYTPRKLFHRWKIKFWCNFKNQEPGRKPWRRR